MSEITLPSLEKLQKRLAEKSSVFGTSKERIERFFAPYLDKQWPEEFLIKAISFFLWELPCALEETGNRTRKVSSLSPVELNSLVKILIKDRKVRRRTLRAVRKAPEPETAKDTAIDEAN